MTPYSFPIFLGDAKSMPFLAVVLGCIQAVSNGVPSTPLDLTSCTEIVVTLPNADGTYLNLKLSLYQVVIDKADLGSFHAVISSVESALLNVGQYQSISVTFTISGNPMTLEFPQGLSVYQST